MNSLGYLPNIVFLLSAAVVIVTIFKRLNLSPVLGYLVAGAAIGQHGFGYVDSNDLGIFAKFGVVFLLFMIGLELTIERLMVMRWHVFGFGTLQVVTTASVIAAFTYYIVGLSLEASIIIGGSLALSSTAIVLRVIADNNSQVTQVGRVSLANLLLQDFAVVPLLVLVPLLALQTDNISVTLMNATGKAFIAMFVIFFVGRMLLRPLFALIASVKSNELFVAATLLVVLGTSLATEYLQLSLALGAFIAGLLVAETQYQHQVEDVIMPFKDLLMGLFFMTVGMTIDLQAIYDQLFLIIELSLGLILCKALIIIILCKLFGFPLGCAIHAGLLLSQGGEFAFILFGLASRDSIGLISHEHTEVLLLVVTATMALTPLLSMLGKKINDRLSKSKIQAELENFDGEKVLELEDLNRHVVIAGFGRVGKMVARLLSVKKVNYVVIESDAKTVKEGRAAGFPVFHGDATKVADLRNIGINRAKTAIIAINEDVYLKRAMRTIHKECPDLAIVARAEDLKHAKSLEKIGPSVIVPEKYEAGLQMAGALLKAIGVSEFEVSRIKNQFRAGNYKWAKEIMPAQEKK